MRNLLSKLDVETFILDLRERITSLPEADGMEFSIRDECTIEASLPKARSLNSLFSVLDQQGIQVVSMRNKANRLEELFMRLVEKGNSA